MGIRSHRMNYTRKEYWVHVKAWFWRVLEFPLPWKDDHFYAGQVDGDEFVCMLCKHRSTRDYVDSLDE